ncbi:MAG: DUF1844 domain-containing protein [Deltaproteobacteria bacterium]|jgi:hypothetical protein|nr:DUF1844 domain-containing protein [Deltaproteobacteria bacterium]
MSEFTIKDRRLFNKDGSVNEEEQTADASKTENTTTAEAVAEEAAPTENSQNQAKSSRIGAGDIEATLTTLIIGLATTAMIQLGEQSPDGTAVAQKPDLVSAKHTIDILAILKQKTLGNLDHSEESLLETLLYDLRMKYVSVKGKV